MKQQGLAFFTDTHLTAIGLLIFFGFFLGVLFWTLRKTQKATYDKLAQIPLEGE
ncbi:CcoQ/FixQ family Cbb3-type cytochrome c oxidase assembly chaperone [Bdellovibrio sp. HCB337]|uniref:CcoQ/FixQ family Cbb3-type cytochrome c oxidase assembly chaperone n=1 Tax=Bdellovibrio sp. HCB337 TaxID=3394358 RepID=UPI0039A4075E